MKIIRIGILNLRVVYEEVDILSFAVITAFFSAGSNQSANMG
jgi:hypothetical protein